jgi:hypothetical protein
MKADHVITTVTTEAVSSHPGEKGHWSQNGGETPPVPENHRRGWEKVPANVWSRQRITIKAHAGRGLETIWEIPIKTFPNNSIQPT